LWLAAAIAAILYLGSVTNAWWPTADSALYMGLGRSLAEGQGYTFNGKPHGFVTPGLPLTLAALRVVFGESYLAPNLFMAFCGLGALALVYVVMSRYGNRDVAFATVLCCAFSFAFYFNSHRILTDIPFTLLFWLVVCFLLRASTGRAWLALVAMFFAAVAMTVRVPGLLLVGALAVGVALDRMPKGLRRRCLLCVAGVLATAVVTALALHFLGRSVSGQTSPYFYRIRTLEPAELPDRVERVGRGIPAIFTAISYIFTGQEAPLVVAIPLMVLAVVGGVVLWQRGQRMGLVTTVLYVLALAFLGSGGAVRNRYLLPVQPFIVLLTIEGLLWTARGLCRLKKWRLPESLHAKVLAAFTFLVLAANAPRILQNAVYYTYLSYTPRYYEVVRDGHYAPQFRIAKRLRKACPPDRLVAVAKSELRVLHYLSGRRFVGLPYRGRRTGKDAERTLSIARSAPEIAFLLVDVHAGRAEFRETLQQALASSADFREELRDGNWRMYRRVSGKKSQAER
jgi:4-amino-4-deoxy-L-arabinose transferase-like glycosyltransferase